MMKILQCDDSEADALLCQHALKDGGLAFSHRWVSTRKDFEAAILQGNLDIVLIDYYLPEYRGDEALAFCRANAPGLPVIFVSGTIDDEQAIEALKLGATDYVLKHRLARLPRAVRRAHEEAISRRERAEALRQLEETELFLQTAMELGEIGSWSSSLEGDGKLTWSRGAHRIFGLEMGTAGPTRAFFFKLVHPDDLAAVTDAVTRAIESRGDYGVDHRVLRPDGAVRWVHEQGRVVCDDEGRPVKLVGVVQDITDRKASEDRIREQAALLDVAQSAIVTHSLEGKILFWNRGAEQLYGWAAAEAVGSDLSCLLHPDSAEKFNEVRRLAIEHGEWHGEMEQATRGGQRVACDSRWSVVRDGNGRLQSILSVNTDLTERKKLEQQFLRAQRMECVGTLASGIAHDINNVLAPIMMSVELFRMKLTGQEDCDLLDILEASAKRGAEIVRQVLTFARGAEGQRGVIPLERAVKEVAKILRETFPRSIQIQVHLDRGLWLVRGDPTHIYQVLMNLSVNARDAMQRGGRLSLEAGNVNLGPEAPTLHAEAKPGPYVRLSVRDSGTGIAPDVMARIFDPFFTTKEPGQGTGLGLSTVQSLIRGHGGFITVESVLGHGTSMHAYLPAEPSTAAADAGGDELAPAPGRGETILVVDDEATIRVVTRTTLEANNYTVLTAKDGLEAVSIFPKQPGAVRLVVTDLMMPAMDGATMIRALQEIDPNLRFIVVSGLMDAEKVPHSPASRPIAFLAKPFGSDELLRLIRQTLDS